MNLSSSARLAFAIQSVVQVASMELEGTNPHFLISKSCSPWLCGFVFSRTGAREACLEAGKVKPPLLGHQPPPVPKSKFLHCLERGGGGGCPNQPCAQIWILLPAYGAQGKEKGSEAFEKVSPAPLLSTSPCHKPSHTPVVHLLARPQLFPFYDILGSQLPAKPNLYYLIGRKKKSS